MLSPATPSAGLTPQRPKNRSGAGDALFSERPLALLLRARRFDENGPARPLNRRSWLHVQAMKADKPRLSACASNGAMRRLIQGAVSCFGDLAGRSRGFKR